jgi:protein TonB
MNEDCKNVREELALTGGDVESAAAREHVAGCPDCTRFVETLRRVESDLRSLSGADVSDEVVAKLLARKELRANPRRTRWSVPAAALATAASAVVALSLLLNYLNRSPETFVDEVDRYYNEEPRKNEPGRAGTVAPEPSADEDTLRQRDLPEGEGLLSEDKRSELAKEQPVEREREQKLELGKKDSELAGGYRYDVSTPAPLVRRDPVYPDAARNARVEGTVVVEVTVDRAGNVVDARIVESIPLLDQAALDAVREWKYEPVDAAAPRVFRVSISFVLPDQEGEALSLLEERERVEGLRFLEPRGYWANTYLPGDPMLRQLARRLETKLGAIPALHESARPAALPFDPSSTSALSFFVHADRSGITSTSRLLVQVGIRARDHHGRRRPPMNVGVVLDLPEVVSPSDASALNALVQSLASSREPGDRFRVVTSQGREIPPEDLSYGAVTLALRDWLEVPSPDVVESLARALENVHAGDDPTMPLGTSVVILASGRSVDSELETLLPLVRKSALGGVSVSTVGFGAGAGDASLERIALAGQGRRYDLALAEDAARIVEGELASAGRAVARALRLRIQLAEGVRLVGVLGSERLSERAASRVRAEERSIDRRLQRNLGLEADRGRDEDGIQIVVPTFYAGDAHSILLDVVAEGPGPIVEVTARYKDLVQLDNTVARASLSLPRSEAAPGPLQASVVKDYLGFRLSEALESAGESLDSGDRSGALACLEATRALLREVGSRDADLERDVALLDGYIAWLPRLSTPDEERYLASSLLYASALKRLPPRTAAS